MSNPRAFISFDFDHDESDKNLFAGQAKHSKTPFNSEDWSSKSSLQQSEWEKIIHDKINMCNLMIILVGRFMSSAGGIGREIEFAEKHNVPVFGVYINGAGNNSTLPKGLSRNRVITWNWDSIAAALNQVMKEGKNK